MIPFRSFNHRMYTVILMLCLNMCNVSQYRFCLCYFFKFILTSHYHIKIQMHMMYIYKQGHQYTFLNLIWVEPLWLMTCVFSWCGVVFCNTCLIYQSWKISKQFYHSSSKLIVNLFTSKNNFIKVAWCNLASRKAAPKHYLKGRLKGER